MTGDKLMPELYFKQQGFTYSACGPFTKHHEKIQKIIETGNLTWIRQSLICNDAAYSDSKGLAKRTISDKTLKGRAMKLLEDVNMMDIKEF